MKQIPHPNDWRCVSLEQRKDLPDKSGVYAVMDERSNIYYIGRSVDLRSRWASGHHRYSQAEELKSALLAYLPLPKSQINAAELSLIHKFQPPWNGTEIPSDRDDLSIWPVFAAVVFALAAMLLRAWAEPIRNGSAIASDSTRTAQVAPGTRQQQAIATGRFNLRTSPSTADDRNIVGVVNPGDAVTLTGRTAENQHGNWVQVRVGDGQTAWIAASAFR